MLGPEKAGVTNVRSMSGPENIIFEPSPLTVIQSQRCVTGPTLAVKLHPFLVVVFGFLGPLTGSDRGQIHWSGLS